PTSGGIIRNNFIHTSRDVGIGLESAADPKVYHNTIVTNNYFNSIEYRFSGTTNVHIANNLTTEAIKTRDGGSGLVETNFITNDRSIFVDADNFDYHLAHNPPAEVLDAGTMLADGGIDFDCEDRVTGIGPDLGADETPFIVKTLENNAFEAFRFSPNPSHGYLLVENAMPGKKATILSLSGKEMYVEKIVSNSFEMDISPLHAGFYYLVIQAQNGGSIYRGKFVKR
ncbi:MAG: T9SS type A sorting domain-containing protein, partial [Saprospiraceae bacterium]|nr:T9SS type A sorting domain-containing protein [Saprospiraceae bacterium]